MAFTRTTRLNLETAEGAATEHAFPIDLTEAELTGADVAFSVIDATGARILLLVATEGATESPDVVVEPSAVRVRVRLHLESTAVLASAAREAGPLRYQLDVAPVGEHAQRWYIGEAHVIFGLPSGIGAEGDAPRLDHSTYLGSQHFSGGWI